MTNNTLSKVFTFVMLIIISVALAGGLYFGNKRLNKIEDLLILTDDGSEPVIQQEVTIADILQYREDVRHFKYIDSIYMTMPDVVLIDILVNHGTLISNEEIVNIYLSNPDTYNKKKSQQRYDGYKEFVKPKDQENQSDNENELVCYVLKE